MMRSMSICHNIQHKQGNGQTAWLSCFADASEEHGLLPARHHRKSFGNSGSGDVSGRLAALYDSFPNSPHRSAGMSPSRGAISL